MKKIILIIIFFPIIMTFGQKIGELAEEKPNIVFPPHQWGADIMFSDGGFGLGTFFRKTFNNKFKGFIDISVSEQKSEREFVYYDYYGRPITIGKENRVFYIPLNVGVQYRLFEKVLTDNLRPYLTIGVGPSLAISTPFSEEFFNSFKYADFQLAVGGYVGFGANFGLSKRNLLGINMRYYYSKLLGKGVEPMLGEIKTTLGGFYINLDLGIMY